MVWIGRIGGIEVFTKFQVPRLEEVQQTRRFPGRAAVARCAFLIGY